MCAANANSLNSNKNAKALAVINKADLKSDDIRTVKCYFFNQYSYLENIYFDKTLTYALGTRDCQNITLTYARSNN